MRWEILEYETTRGERPIAQLIKKQESKTMAKIIHTIDLLEIHGNLLGMPHAKKINSNLYELRIRGKEEIRIFYGFVGRTIYLLSGFKKQKQKTPKKEIEIAKRRILSWT